MNLKKFLESLSIYTEHFTPEQLDFYNELLENQNGVNQFTENGLKILKCMKENCEARMNIFNSKMLGEMLFMPPRSVSGSMKKLIADGYVEKVGVNPVSYGLTDLGKDFQIDI